MSNSAKLLKRILESKKIPNDISANQFLNLAEYLGLTVCPGKGSHFHVYEMDKNGNVTWHTMVVLGHPEPIDPKAIKQLKEKLLDE